METANKTLEKLEILKEMFPEVITETKDANGDIVSAVDAKKLEQLLSTKVIEGDESYDFTWVGKKQAMVEANRPIRKTLRPCKEESVDWENTENLYIEGDNLDVLKLLQESYLNKIKMIYIDPPYNTGNDSFIYPDDYKTNKDQYDEEVGAIDESGYRMFKNTETNGRFHSSWCSMMYPRLKLARNLLSEDGVIFISIDDNEVDNMRKMCDEVFGESNFIAQCVRKRRDSQANLSKNISPIHEYITIYGKNNGDILNKIPAKIDVSEYKNPDNDERGPYKTMPCTNKGGAIYSVQTPTGKIITDEWRFKKETYDKLFSENKLVFPRGGDGKPRYKLFLSEKEEQGVLANTWLDNLASNQEASREIKEFFDNLLFETPKPVGLLSFCSALATNKSSTILDFFSGSATTAHAVMQLNAEDGGNRKFIMVQLPEVCDEKSEAYKAGYKNICEIGKERIRRAGNKIKEETGKQDLDIGFRVLKLDESNMKDVYYAPADYNQSMLDRMTSNIKEDRTSEDLLYACMLEWGLELSLPHKVENIAGFNVHIVNDGDLIACFENKISEEAIKQIADKKPLRAVFRDSSFASDASRVNVGEIFKLKSPNTTIKVI